MVGKLNKRLIVIHLHFYKKQDDVVFWTNQLKNKQRAGANIVSGFLNIDEYKSCHFVLHKQ